MAAPTQLQLYDSSGRPSAAIPRPEVACMCGAGWLRMHSMHKVCGLVKIMQLWHISFSAMAALWDAAPEDAPKINATDRFPFTPSVLGRGAIKQSGQQRAVSSYVVASCIPQAT